MKNGVTTSEFWASIITNLVGICIVVGAIRADDGAEMAKAMNAAVGAVLSIAATLGYIKSRTQLKQAELRYHRDD